MIRQESTYDKDTYKELEYKEYSDDVLIIHKKRDKDGNLIYSLNSSGSGRFLNGEKHGAWIEHVDADCEIYGKSFRISQKGKYYKGKINGNWSCFYESGELYYSDAKFKDSKIANQKINFFHKTGEIKLTAFYKDGKNEGQWIWYYTNGNIYQKTTYSQGNIHGQSITYDINGQVLKSDEYFNGKLLKSDEFYINSNL